MVGLQLLLAAGRRPRGRQVLRDRPQRSHHKGVVAWALRAPRSQTAAQWRERYRRTPAREMRIDLRQRRCLDPLNPVVRPQLARPGRARKTAFDCQMRRSLGRASLLCIAIEEHQRARIPLFPAQRRRQKLLSFVLASRDRSYSVKMPRGDIADLTATANLTCRNAQRNAFLFIGIPK